MISFDLELYFEYVYVLGGILITSISVVIITMISGEIELDCLICYDYMGILIFLIGQMCHYI